MAFSFTMDCTALERKTTKKQFQYTKYLSECVGTKLKEALLFFVQRRYLDSTPTEVNYLVNSVTCSLHAKEAGNFGGLCPGIPWYKVMTNQKSLKLERK